MGFHSDLHHRRSIRLQGYDYAQAGAYFVTVCTQNRECLFGEVSNGKMRLNEAGKIVTATWQTLPQRFPSVVLDVFVTMPNHIHGILYIVPVGAQFIAPGQFIVSDQSIAPNQENQGATDQGAMNQGVMNQGAINRAPTLGDMICVLKAVSTRQIRQAGQGRFAWQRNYYEHIIRDEASLVRIREYIINNPLQWAMDRENPVNMSLHGEA